VAIKFKRYYSINRIRFRAHKGRRHKEFAKHGTIFQPEVYSVHAKTSINRIYAPITVAPVATVTKGTYKKFPAAQPNKLKWKTPSATAAAATAKKAVVPLTPAQILAAAKAKTGITKGWSAP
jgi:hypothetical protein